MIETVDEVVVNELILGKDLVFFEVLSESFLFFIREKLQLSELNFEILFHVKQLIFFVVAEVKFLDKVILFLLKEVLAGVEPFCLFFELGD